MGPGERLGVILAWRQPQSQLNGGFVVCLRVDSYSQGPSIRARLDSGQAFIGKKFEIRVFYGYSALSTAFCAPDTMISKSAGEDDSTFVKVHHDVGAGRAYMVVAPFTRFPWTRHVSSALSEFFGDWFGQSFILLYRLYLHCSNGVAARVAHA